MNFLCWLAMMPLATMMPLAPLNDVARLPHLSPTDLQERVHVPGLHGRSAHHASSTDSAMTPNAKLLPPSTGPRLIVYHQTFHDANGTYHSLLPLLTNNTGITHVIVAAIHLNDGPGNITLNDHRPDDKRFDQLWGEVNWLQGSGVKVLGMLGGAAKGSYEKLSGDEESVCHPPFHHPSRT